MNPLKGASLDQLVEVVSVTSLRSDAERVGVRCFALLPQRGALQRFKRARVIDVEHDVKLIGHAPPATSS